MNTESIASSHSSSTSSATAPFQNSKDESIEPLLTQVFVQLKSAASTVNHLTSAPLTDFQQSEMKKGLDGIVATMNEMRLRHGDPTLANADSSTSIFGSNGLEYEYSDIDDLELNLETLTDKFLENVDRYLLEYQQLKGKPDPEAKFAKPQMNWKEKPDNSNQVFSPFIREKPNALVPLHEVMSKKQELDASIENFPYSRLGFGLGGDVRRDSKPHPYLPELKELKFRDDQLKPCKVHMYKNMDAVPCHWIDTKESLLKLSSLLDTQVEFAIDLEHHSYRTYQGMTCLMQISTRDEDYLIDTIALRDEMYVLNTSFTNPKIVKVMHGADCDILWLQRDCGIYIVNLFDTGQAARLLGISPAYASVLPYYCSIVPDKKYQLADWRLRPLPSVMIHYARTDTHYLLYIYDRLRNDIYDQRNGRDGLQLVLEKSRNICMRRYEKFIYEEYSHFYLRKKFNGITQQEDNILRELFKWRDSVSREHDESVRYVLPDDTLVFVATKKPITIQKLLHICSPASKILKDNALTVVQLIQKALGDEYVPEDFPNTPAKDSYDAMNISKDSPILDLVQLCQQAHWFSKPDIMQSLTFTNDMTDTTPHRPHFSSTVFIPEGSQTSLFNSNIPKNPGVQTPGYDLMDLCSPSSAAKPAPATFPMNPQPEETQNVETKFLDKHHFETPIMTPPSSKNGGDNTPPDERVPKSLHEIYRLSQQNRERNKEKKKLKQSSVSDPRPAYSPDSPGEQSPTQFDDPNEFMDQIGWKLRSPNQDPMIVSPIPIHTEKEHTQQIARNDNNKRTSNKSRKAKR